MMNMPETKVYASIWLVNESGRHLMYEVKEGQEIVVGQNHWGELGAVIKDHLSFVIVARAYDKSRIEILPYPTQNDQNP